MAKFSLRRYDTQARVSLLLSLLSIVPLAAMTYFILQQFDFNEMGLFYGPLRKIAILGSALATIMLAVGGFGFGLNSVGQRRNDKAKLSWIGFFIGAAVLSLAIIGVCLFMSRGQPVIQ